ncbi:MAG: VWA domain-containing protein [Pseudomonadota bacterium]
MFEFTYPLAFLALPLPALAWFILPPHKQRKDALRVPFFSKLVDAAGAQAGDGAVVSRPDLRDLVLLIGAWCVLVAALAKPQWLSEPIERTEAARDIMLAIDLSGSMDTRDFTGLEVRKLSRLKAVQRVVAKFVDARESDRIGLIVFGDKAYLQLPFTRDTSTAASLVELMDVGMAGPRTALGDAIGLAMHAFESSEVQSRILILLTDGNDTASVMTPLNAAGIAATSGIEIHTIGIGDTQATGEERVDFDTLQQIATRTGGLFHTAADELGLAAVYQQIDESTAVEARVLSWRPKESLVAWPAVLTALVLSLVLSKSWFRKPSQRHNS